MTLEITPRWIPKDGPGFRPERDLRRFVENVDISGFGASNFESNLSFVTAQTEEPSGATRGSLWFKRGDGRLYIYDMDFYGPHSYDSAYTGTGLWVALSDRKEVLVRLYTSDNATLTITPYWPSVFSAFASASTNVTTQTYRHVPQTQRRGSFGDRLFKMPVWRDIADRTSAVTLSGPTEYRYEVVVDVGYGVMIAAPGTTGPAPLATSDAQYTGPYNPSAPYEGNEFFQWYMVESTYSAMWSNSSPAFYKTFCWAERRRWEFP